MKENILFKPFPEQNKWIEEAASGKYQFILAAGSVRSGKTYFILGFFIFMCKLFPGSKYVVVRKNLQRIKSTVFPTFNQICPPEFLEQEPTSHNSFTAKFTNGSQIVFFAENKDKDKELKRFRGMEADGFGLEELDISYDGFMMALQRTGTWKMRERKEAKERGDATPPQIVLGTSNPQNNWVKEEIYDKWKKGTLNPKWLYINANLKDNPYIPKEWIDSQKQNLSPLIYKMLMEGDWELDLNKNPFFYEYNLEKHEAENLEIDKNNILYLSFDFNYSPSSVVVFQFDEIKGLRFYKSLQAVGGLRFLLDKLDWIRKGGYEIVITGDNNGHARSAAGNVTCYSEIESYFLVPVSDVTKKANALHTFSRRICNDTLLHIPTKFDKEGCKGLISEIKQAKPTDTGGLSKKPDLHLVDSFRYAINILFRSREDIIRMSNQIKNNNKTNEKFLENHKEYIIKNRSKIKLK